MSGPNSGATNRAATFLGEGPLIDRLRRPPSGDSSGGGPPGPPGAPGTNAFTTVAAPGFVQPIVGASVAVPCVVSSWAVPGQVVFIENGGYYSVSSIAVGSITAVNLGYAGNAAPATAIPVGSKVSPGGVQGTAGAPGTPGTDGIDAFTTVAPPGFVQPIVGGSVAVPSVESAWAVPGQVIFIENGGYYSVLSIAPGLINANNLGYTGNAAPTTAIPAGSRVSPGGVEGIGGGPVFGDLSGDLPFPRVSRVDNAFVQQAGLSLAPGDVLTATDTTNASTMAIDGSNAYLLRPGSSDFVDWILTGTTSTATSIARFDQEVPPGSVDGAVGIATDVVSNRVWFTTREQNNTIFQARRIDPDSEVIDATVDITAQVPGGPGACAYEPVSETLWVIEPLGNNLARIDSNTLVATTQALPGVTLATGVFALNGRIYVCCDAGRVFQVDPVTSVATPFALGGPSDVMTEGDGLAGAFLWFGNRSTDQVVRVTEPALGGLTTFATGQSGVECVRYIPAAGAGPERVVALATTSKTLLEITTPQTVMTAGPIKTLPPDGSFGKCWANPLSDRLYVPSATTSKLVALTTNTAVLQDEAGMPSNGYSAGGVVTWKPVVKARFPHDWHLNGNIALAPTDTTPLGLLAADGGIATFDGVIRISQRSKIVELLANLRAPGSSGSVDVEFIRVRPRTAFFSLGIASISALGPFETAFATPPTSPDDILIPDDIVFVRMLSVQGGSPSDLTLQMTLEVQ